MENAEKENNSNEEDDGIETSFDFRTKGRFGKKTWRKLLIGLGTVATGSVALAQIVRRMFELWH